MMDFGLTATGFTRKLLTEIAEEILSDERGTISAALDGSESTAIGNINLIFADQASQAWEALEELVAGMDPENATDNQLVALALLTGVVRRGPQKGLCTCTIGLDASQLFAPGTLVAHVTDEPENRWLNRDIVESTTAGSYTGVVFESEDTGVGFQAALGTLVVIATPVTGWNSITNPEDATAGTDQEAIETLRARREASLALAGSGTVDAIRADVLAVDGVLQCKVEENVTDSTSGGLLPHSFRAVVWDGSPAAADDDEIAQAIQDTRPAGIFDNGTETGSAIKKDGELITVHFERATEVPIYVSANITSAVGVASADVKAAIQAAMPTLLGGDVVYHKLSGSVFIEGVDDYASFTIGIAPAPVGTSTIAISSTEIATLDNTNIVLTGDVS